MDDNKKYLFIGLAILAIGIIIWYFTSNSKKEKTSNFVPEEKSEVKPQPEKVTPPETFPLRLGIKGKEAEQLQIFLLRNYGAGFPDYGVNGEITPETVDNMIKFLNTPTLSKAKFMDHRMNDLRTAKYK